MTNIVTVMGFCVCNLGVPKSLAITVIYSHKTLSRSNYVLKSKYTLFLFSINCITNDKWSSYCIDHTFKSCEIYLILSVGERIGVLCEWPSDRDLTSAWVQEEIVQGLGRSCSYVFHTVWTSLCKQKIYIYTTAWSNYNVYVVHVIHNFLNFCIHQQINPLTKESGSEATTVVIVSPNVWDSRMVMLYVCWLKIGGWRFLLTLMVTTVVSYRAGYPLS